MATDQITISVTEAESVSGIVDTPTDPVACYVFAHGAGAGMTHPFMTAVAQELAAQRVATVRYQFPYMERRGNRPDTPAVAHTAVRAAVSAAAVRFPGMPLFAGGKSFGGRMTSQAQAAEPMAGLRGLIFVGFPLHPARRPSTDRAKHLAEIKVPMLFLQGTRDELAELSLLESVCKSLGARTTLKLFPEADHAFHVPARTGRKDGEVRAELVNTVVTFMKSVIGR